MSIPDENVPNDYADSQLAGHMKLVREIEQRLEDRRKPEPKLTRRETVGVGLIVGGLFLLWVVWTGSWPVPRGKENRKQAAAFLKKEFPDRQLVPNTDESVTAPVAALFHVIRDGEPKKAAKAIAFAGEQEFGYASPYVIERLESDDPRLRAAARDFLQRISGRDFGPQASAWKAWWRDPPRSLLGIVTVGHNTFQFAIPIAASLIGVLLAEFGRGKRRNFVTVLSAALLLSGWFQLIGTLGLHLVGGFNTCVFGGTRIAYYSDHGVVLGLKDARVGGFGLWLLLVAAYLVVPLIVALVYMVVSVRWQKETPAP
jgi:hypothetical protein